MDKSRVKPLEWQPRSSGFWVATTNFAGHYIVTQYAGMPQPFKLEGQGFWNVRGGHFETLEAAKAAAQADYEARILAALEPVTVQEAARVLLGEQERCARIPTQDRTPKEQRLAMMGRNRLRALAETVETEAKELDQ